jgi:hypothetical protein
MEGRDNPLVWTWTASEWLARSPACLETVAFAVEHGVRYLGPLYTPAEVAEEVAKEREACAAVCGELTDRWTREWRAGLKVSTHLEGMSDGADECAEALRARAAQQVADEGREGPNAE